MKSECSTIQNATIAASVAPEDLACGDFVAVLNEVIAYPSYMWFDFEQSNREELIRVRCIPAGAGTPLKVKAICLPFVFVKPPTGNGETLDVRRHQLVRLNQAYAKTVWKAMREQTNGKESEEILP